MEVAGVAQQHGDPLEDAAGGCGQPGQGGDLADDDEHDQAGDETGDDRLAEELRDPAQAEHADRDEHDTGRDRQHRGQLHRELGVTAGQGAHDRAGQHRDGRDRPDEQQPRGAEQRVGEQGRRQGVEADLHGHTRDDGVPEGLGDGEGGDEQAGEDVGGQVASGVPAQQTQPDGEARRWRCTGQSAAARAPRWLAAMVAHVRDQDVIVVASMDRLARSVVDLDKLVSQLTATGVTVRFLKEGLSFLAVGQADPLALLRLQVMGAFAQLERALIRDRQREGIEAAKARGVYRGRARRVSLDQVVQARAEVVSGVPKAVVARRLGVARQTLYDALAASSSGAHA